MALGSTFAEGVRSMLGENEIIDNSVCSFTGHRIIPAAHFVQLPSLIDRGIGYVYTHGCRRFLCGGAIGFDTMAAERVIAFRAAHPDVALEMILPCMDQDSLWSFEQKRAYRRILELADKVEYLTTVYYEGCMHARNRRLVRDCDFLIAYVTRQGGAMQTLMLAEDMGKHIYNLAKGIRGRGPAR